MFFESLWRAVYSPTLWRRAGDSYRSKRFLLQHHRPELPPQHPLLEGSVGHTVPNRKWDLSGKFCVFPQGWRDQASPIQTSKTQCSRCCLTKERTRSSRTSRFWPTLVYGKLTWLGLTPESHYCHRLWIWPYGSGFPSSPSPPALGPQLNSTVWIMSGIIYSYYTDKALPDPSLFLWPLYAQTANLQGDICLIASESCSVQMVQAPAWERRDTGRRSLGFFSGYTHKYERSHCFPEPSKPPNPCKHQLAHKDGPDKAGQHPTRA